MNNRVFALAGLMSAAFSLNASVTGIPGDPELKTRFNQELLARSPAAVKNPQRDIAVFTGDTVIPQFVDGGGWKTTVTTTNLESFTVHFVVLFFNDDGSDLTIRIIGQGNVRGVDIVLGSAQSSTFETAGDAQFLAQGWATIRKDNSGDSIGGFAIFRQRVSGRQDSEAVVPIVSQFDSHFVLLYDNSAGYVTGMAIANPTSSSVVVPINIRNESGQVIDRRTESLGPFEHTAFAISDFWPSTSGLRGSIEFITSGFGVGVLGLRFNPGGAFTSFHVLSNIKWLTQ
jgi:hypothetical protein